MNDNWVEVDIRDSVVDFVHYWVTQTGYTKLYFIHLLGLVKSKFYQWVSRYGKATDHNNQIPRDYWLNEDDKKLIIDYFKEHSLEGYRRLTYMMMDSKVIAVSPSTTYRVLSTEGLLDQWNSKPSKKGTGFIHPTEAHEHWHIDISYLNFQGTFYYLFSILDGFSRSILQWDIRESMKEQDVEHILQQAREKYPGTKPRIISDNGPQFIAKDFKEFIRLTGMTHVKTSPYYPQSNGKLERWHKSLKSDCIREIKPQTICELKSNVADYINHYNHVRLHSALGYITPGDKLNGHADEIFIRRETQLAEARADRKSRNKQAKAA